MGPSNSRLHPTLTVLTRVSYVVIGNRFVLFSQTFRGRFELKCVKLLNTVQGQLQRFQAESPVECIGELPRQHIATEPIEHRHYIQETALQRGDLGRLDLIGSSHRQIAQ